MKKILEYRFHEKYIKDKSGCWLWISGKFPSGYGRFFIKGKTPQGAHRVMWQLTNRYIPDGKYILHKCDIRNCVNPNHLYIGTHRDNMRDMVSRHRNHSGESNYQAKLKNCDAEKIRNEYKSDITSFAILSKKYKVSKTLIQNVVQGKSYRRNAKFQP